jgi:flagellar protein FlbB
MSAASTVTNLLKIIFLLILIVVILLAGVYWFDHLGLVDYNKFVGPFERYLPMFMKKGVEVTEEPVLLEEEFLRKREEMLLAKTRELEIEKQELERNRLELQELRTKLAEDATRLEEEKKVLSEERRQYDNYRENIKTQAGYFTNMPPAAAVERIAQLDDLLAIDILREIDATAEEEGRISVVPFLLSIMDPEKAATLQRKMTKVGE